MVLKIRRFWLMAICLCLVMAILFLGPWAYLKKESSQTSGFRQNYSKEVLVRLMQNYLQDDVSDFYQAYYLSPTYVDAEETVITDIRKYNDNHYAITFGVKPYIGAHNAIGYDEIQYAVRPFGTPEKVHYAHLRNYELPESMRSLQIRKPNTNSEEER